MNRCLKPSALWYAMKCTLKSRLVKNQDTFPFGQIRNTKFGDFERPHATLQTKVVHPNIRECVNAVNNYSMQISENHQVNLIWEWWLNMKGQIPNDSVRLSIRKELRGSLLLFRSLFLILKSTRVIIETIIYLQVKMNESKNEKC